MFYYCSSTNVVATKILILQEVTYKAANGSKKHEAKVVTHPALGCPGKQVFDLDNETLQVQGLSSLDLTI